VAGHIPDNLQGWPAGIISMAKTGKTANADGLDQWSQVTNVGENSPADLATP
jgi:hypothetical protein